MWAVVMGHECSVIGNKGHLFENYLYWPLPRTHWKGMRINTQSQARGADDKDISGSQLSNDCPCPILLYNIFPISPMISCSAGTVPPHKAVICDWRAGGSQDCPPSPKLAFTCHTEQPELLVQLTERCSFSWPVRGSSHWIFLFL